MEKENVKEWKSKDDEKEERKNSEKEGIRRSWCRIWWKIVHGAGQGGQEV